MKEIVHRRRRHLRDQRLQAREAGFATVIDNPTQGVVVFDKDRRVVLCNKRYREIYGMTPEQVAPGTPTSQLISRRLELGLKVPADPTEYIRQRTSGEVKVQTRSRN